MGVAYIFLTTVGFKEGDDCFLHINVQASLQPSPWETELVKVSYFYLTQKVISTVVTTTIKLHLEPVFFLRSISILSSDYVKDFSYKNFVTIFSIPSYALHVL